MTIGEHIKAAREQAGITQVELGAKVGVSGVAIMRYEKNTRQPRVEQLQAIANALGVPVADLLPEPTAEERAALLGIIQEVGFPRSGDITLGEAKILLQRVAAIYGEQSAFLLRLTSFMNDAGVEKVIEYAKSIFQEYMDESIPRASEGPQEDAGHKKG